MPEYIEREALIDDIEKHHCGPCKEEGNDYKGVVCRACWVDDMILIIDAAPTISAVPVAHGRWVKPVPGDGENYCSACKANQPWFYGYGYYESDYCPQCGAKMDLEG